MPTPIRDNKVYYHNKKLYDLAKKHDLFIPKLHTLCPIIPEMLRRDWNKFNDIPPWAPNEIALAKAFCALKHIYRRPFSHNRILTLDEAIQRAEKNTSPGYIWGLRGCKTKGEFFEQHYDWLKKEVEAVFDGSSTYVPIAKAGPKVEIRSKEKLLNPNDAKNRQRTFTVVDPVYYIVALMLYGDQNDQLHATATNTSKGRCFWNLVGMTMFHGGMNRIAAELLRGPLPDKFICLDISAQEASQTTPVMEGLYGIRNCNLPASTIHAQRWFKRHKIFTHVVDPDGNLGVTDATNPSGCLNTLDDNTLTTILGMLYHLAKKNPGMNEELIAELAHQLPAKVIGDDSMIRDHPLWEAVEHSFLELGMVTTNECGPPGTSVPILEAKIMNTNFTWDHNHSMFIPRPNFDKLFAGLFFYRKSNSWRLTYAKLCAMRILCYSFKKYLHDIDLYMSYVEQNFDTEMQNETWLDQVLSYQNLFTMRLPDATIESLIYGSESFGGHNNIPEIKHLEEVLAHAFDFHHDWLQQEKEFDQEGDL